MKFSLSRQGVKMPFGKSQAEQIICSIEARPSAKLIMDMARKVPQSKYEYQLAQWLLTENFPLGEDILNKLYLEHLRFRRRNVVFSGNMIELIIAAIYQNTDDTMHDIDNSILECVYGRDDIQDVIKKLKLAQAVLTIAPGQYPGIDCINFLLKCEGKYSNLHRMRMKFLVTPHGIYRDIIDRYSDKHTVISAFGCVFQRMYYNLSDVLKDIEKMGKFDNEVKIIREYFDEK